MNGSCIECPPQKGEEEEIVILSFYNDISQNTQIMDQAVMIPQNIHRLLVNIMKYLQRWKRYRPLWKLDKSIVMEKFAAKKPPCVAYDEKLQFYAKIAADVMRHPLVKDEHCIRLQLEPLANTVQENAKSWVTSLGKLLNESAREELYSLRDEIEVPGVHHYLKQTFKAWGGGGGECSSMVEHMQGPWVPSCPCFVSVAMIKYPD